MLVTGALGVNGVYSVLASAELYDPKKGKWSVTGSMSVVRTAFTATLLQNGEVLVAGGSNLDGSSNNTADLYNAATGKWTATTNMPSSHNAPATLLLNGKVLVSGGGGVLYDLPAGNGARQGLCTTVAVPAAPLHCFPTVMC